MAQSRSLDFSNVKETAQFNKKHYPEGDYKGKVLGVVDAKKKDDPSKKMWLFTIQVKTGKYPLYCGFGEKELWKIRNLFVAAGINVPKKRVKANPKLVVGKTIGVTLEDEEYEGKMQSSVAATFPPSELEESDDSEVEDEVTEEEEEEVEEEAEEPEEEEEEEEETEDSDEEEEEEEEPAPKPKKKKKKKAKKPTDDDEELEELDIEDL